MTFNRNSKIKKEKTKKQMHKKTKKIRSVCAVFLFAGLLGTSLGGYPDWDVVILNDTVSEMHGAKCLDGTAPGFYIRKSTTGSTNWLIHLQGGGWCVSLDDCFKRSLTPLGSSKTYVEEKVRYFVKFGDAYFWFLRILYLIKTTVGRMV